MGTKKSLSKTYVISWYGPFHSIEETKDWLCQNDNIDCRLYLVQGKKPNAKNYSYYCGQTTRTVPERFNDKDHHIREIPNKRNIWIGAFGNRYNKEDIDIAENMFIHLLSIETNEHCINDRKRDFHSLDCNVFFVSKWNNPKRHCQPECSIKLLLPEVVVYFTDTDEVKTAKKLRYL